MACPRPHLQPAQVLSAGIQPTEPAEPSFSHAPRMDSWRPLRAANVFARGCKGEDSRRRYGFWRYLRGVSTPRFRSCSWVTGSWRSAQHDRDVRHGHWGNGGFSICGLPRCVTRATKPPMCRWVRPFLSLLPALARVGRLCLCSAPDFGREPLPFVCWAPASGP